MGKILAVDFGTKRIGLAETDPLQIIASGLDTVENKDIFKYLDKYFKNEDVDEVVIGEPKRMDDTPSESEESILKFIEKLRKVYPKLEIKRFDERFTSKMAFQTMIDSGIGKKARRNKALIDKISATIILQSYLESKEGF